MKRFAFGGVAAAFLIGVAQAAQTSHQTKNLVFASIGLAFFMIAGALCFYWMTRYRKQAEAARDWPVADAVVTEASVGSTGDSRSGRSRHRTWYQPKIAYRFKLHGAEYTGHRRRIGFDNFSSQRAVIALLDNFRPGMTIRVHYNPERPEDNVIEPVTKTGSLLFAGMLCAAGALSFAVLLFFLTT